jgi:hypothetical protein
MPQPSLHIGTHRLEVDNGRKPFKQRVKCCPKKSQLGGISRTEKRGKNQNQKRTVRSNVVVSSHSHVCQLGVYASRAPPPRVNRS